MNAINSQVHPVQRKLNSVKAKILLAAAAALGLRGLTASAQANDRYDDRPRYEAREGRIWVAEPAYRTVCEKVWVEPIYKTICEHVWVEPVVQDVCERVWCPDRYEVREVVSYDRYGRRICRRENVLVERGHFAEVHKQVVVSPGHFDKVERQVLASEGHWQNIERRELVSAGHWAPHQEIDLRVRGDRYDRDDRRTRVDFDLSFERRH